VKRLNMLDQITERLLVVVRPLDRQVQRLTKERKCFAIRDRLACP
jgi:hypothetical protein